MAGIVRRRETKYEISQDEYTSLREAVAAHLPLFEFKRGRPYTHISTVYYDTKGQKFFKRAVHDYESSLKLRLKEYYYESAAGSTETTRYCFVELKERHNGEVHKRRLRVPKELVGGFFEQQSIWEQLVARDPGIEHQASTHAIYDELHRFLQSNQVSPVALINYRRVVYQRDERDLRITFDDQLQVSQPTRGLFGTIDALTREGLDTPAHSPKRIMEIKSVGPCPGWLDEALRSYCPQKISKFTTSVDFLNVHFQGRPGANGNGAQCGPKNGDNEPEGRRPPAQRRDQSADDGGGHRRETGQASDAGAVSADPS